MIDEKILLKELYKNAHYDSGMWKAIKIVESQPQLDYCYKKGFDTLVELIHRLKNSLLGEGWYIGGSCGEPQASEIIVDEILNKYGKAKGR